MKLQQEHIKRILDTKNINYEEIDVADPHKLEDKKFMQTTLKLSDDDLVALPPQIFKEKTYRGVGFSFSLNLIIYLSIYLWIKF